MSITKITTSSGAVVTFSDPDAKFQPHWNRYSAAQAAAECREDCQLRALHDRLMLAWYEADTSGDTEAEKRLSGACDAVLSEIIDRDYLANQTQAERDRLNCLAIEFMDSL